MSEVVKEQQPPQVAAEDSPKNKTEGTAATVSSQEDGKPTIGEELFLVHMARHQTNSEEDYDVEGGHKKSDRSVGEELWQVHLARSNGMEPDLDTEENYQSATNNKTKTTKAGRKTTAKPKKSERCSERLVGKVMHLRNRDVTIN